MHPTSLAVTPAAFAPVAPALTLAGDTRSVRWLRGDRGHIWWREDILKRQSFIACAVVLLAASSSVCWATPIAGEDYIPGSLAVAVAPNGPEHPDEVGALLRSVRSDEVVSVDHFFEAPEQMDSIALACGLGRFFLVTVDEDAHHLALLDDLSSLPDVESAELNWLLYPQWTPDDPHFPDQWALEQATDIDMDAPEAWEIERGDSTIVIAILDSGINYSHEDLEHKMWVNEDEVVDGEDTDGNGFVDDVMGWDFVDQSSGCVDPDCLDEDNDPVDGLGHGTHVSGIAGAETDNALGVAGVCPGCTVMPCRVCYDDDGGGACGLFDVMHGLYYATDNGAHVVNMSLGQQDADCVVSYSFDAALEYADNMGVVVVAAAGNYDTNAPMCYPACYPTVIGVANLDIDGDKSDLSNYGDWVDVAAPGVSCHTTMLDSTSYGTKSGTSIASPHVAGLAGLLLSARPDLAPADVRQIIMDSSEPVDWPATPIAAGRVNAYNALAATGVGESDSTTPGRIAHASFPNPFNPVTTIAYELPRPGRVDLLVYSLSGRLVRILLNSAFQPEGSHAVPWRGRDDSGRAVASGAYFYRLNVDGEMYTAKIILVK